MEGQSVAVLVEFNYEDLELWYVLMCVYTLVGPPSGNLCASSVHS